MGRNFRGGTASWEKPQARENALDVAHTTVRRFRGYVGEETVGQEVGVDTLGRCVGVLTVGSARGKSVGALAVGKNVGEVIVGKKLTEIHQ